MGQLRDKIRSMVRKEFAMRMLAEAEKVTSKTVYRSSKYVDMWNDMPMGSPTKTPTVNATKHDFVRWMMKLINNGDKASSTSPIYYSSTEKKQEVLDLLMPLVNKPDEFVEAINKDRELVFGDGNIKDYPDPITYLLTKEYLHNKSAAQSLEKTMKTIEDIENKKKKPATDTEDEYDIIPGATSKADIARMLGLDPTETTTEMSVLNRISKGMKHLGKKKTMEILEFIKDPDVEDSDKKSLLDDLQDMNKLIDEAADEYATLFVDSIFNAAKGKNIDINNDTQVNNVLKVAMDKFKQALEAAGTFSTAVNKGQINPQESNVFSAVLAIPLGRRNLLDTILIAAKRPDEAELYLDEATVAAKEGFLEEMETQTNFNTLGDFTDAMPEVKEIRKNIFDTLESRGRKPGSTKEVLAAKKLAAGR